MSERRTGPTWVYLTLAMLGLIGTAWFTIQGMRQGQGTFLALWFANPATSSLSIDLLVTAVGFTFPLFLALRERHLNR